MTPRSSSTRFRPAKLRSGLTLGAARDRMKGGATLNLEYFKNNPVWTCGGMGVSAETVAQLLACQDIKPTGDSLFPGVPCQSWRISS